MEALLASHDFHLTAPGLEVTFDVRLPLGLQRLAEKMLAGWNFTPTKFSTTPDIEVRRGERYQLFSSYFESGRSWADIVSILNEWLVALAYGVAAQRPKDALVHAAGYSDQTGARVVFGARKSGKSVHVARAALKGAQVFGDDVLLWRTKQASLIGLGIAPRLRRPVLPDLTASAPVGTWITGEYTCYFNKDFINLAPAGTTLCPDMYLEFDEERSLKPVPLWQILSTIARHRISV